MYAVKYLVFTFLTAFVASAPIATPNAEPVSTPIAAPESDASPAEASKTSKGSVHLLDVL